MHRYGNISFEPQFFATALTDFLPLAGHGIFAEYFGNPLSDVNLDMLGNGRGLRIP